MPVRLKSGLPRRNANFELDEKNKKIEPKDAFVVKHSTFLEKKKVINKPGYEQKVTRLMKSSPQW